MADSRNDDHSKMADFKMIYLNSVWVLCCFFYQANSSAVTLPPFSLNSTIPPLTAVVYTLDDKGVFHRHPPAKNPRRTPLDYTVLNSGVLIRRKSEYSIKYNPDERGDLHPDHTNKCVYVSPKRTSYLKAFRNVLIPVEIVLSKAKLHYVFRELKELPVLKLGTPETIEEELFDFGVEKNSSCVQKKKLPALKVGRLRKDMILSPRGSQVVPDKACGSEVTLFVLNNHGVLERRPSDPYLPIGMEMCYSLIDDLVLKPRFKGTDPGRLPLTYVTGENGDLLPRGKDVVLRTSPGEKFSFMLGERGRIFPVKEMMDDRSCVLYFFNGGLVHRSRQFGGIQSNSTEVLVNGRKVKAGTTGLMQPKTGPRFECKERKSCTRHNRVRRALDRRGFRGYHREQPYDDEPFYEHEEEQRYPPEHDRPQVEYEPSSEYTRPREVIHEYARPREVIQEYARPREVIQEYARPREVIQEYQRPREVIQEYQRPREVIQEYARPREVIHEYARPVPATQYEEYLPESGEKVECVEESKPSLSPSKPKQRASRVSVADECGTHFSLLPELTSCQDVILYKLTCKGNLVRYPPCREPEYGFDVTFKLLLDTFTLVPSTNGKGTFISYTLLENGDLMPCKSNKNSFRKAPGSLVIFMLGKNNVLFVVEQEMKESGSVSYYFQGKFLHKTPEKKNQPKFYNTLHSPMYAIFNAKTIFTCHSRTCSPTKQGSNWRNQKRTSRESEERVSKDLYLQGPKRDKIQIVPSKGAKGGTVIYDLDWNGVFYRSPKDSRRCVALRSYNILEYGVLLPTNCTKDNIYIVRKNGDMLPYVCPENKLTAPFGCALKYVRCERGILLPITIEIINDYICYTFNEVIVYKMKSFCIKTGCCDFNEEGSTESSSEEEVKVVKGPKKVEKEEGKDKRRAYFERRGRVLYRHPKEEVPHFLRHTMGSFKIESDDSLTQIQFQDPNKTVLNLMLEPGGHFLEDSRNVRHPGSRYYILSDKGALLSVYGKVSKDHITFYRHKKRLFKVPIGKTPLGSDPLGVLEDSPPKCDGPLTIHLPLNSVVAESCEGEGKDKCERLKKSLKKLIEKDGGERLGIDLEITEEFMKAIKKYSDKCGKKLKRRDLVELLQDMNQGLTVFE